MSKKKSTSDYGTPELSKRKKTRPDLTGKGYAFRVRVMDEDEIDRLLLVNLITMDMHNTLERFQNDLHRAGLMGLKASSPEPRITDGQAQEIGYYAAERRMRVNKAIKYLDTRVGIPMRRMLIAMCMDEFHADDRHSEAIELIVKTLDRFYRS